MTTVVDRKVAKESSPAKGPAPVPRRGRSKVLAVRHSRSQRACERVLAALLLPPIWILGLVASLPAFFSDVPVRACDVVGRHGVKFIIRRWPRPVGVLGRAARSLGLLGGPLLWHVVRGRMAFVGPRPRALREFAACGGGAETAVLPGLLSLRAVRRWGNCAFTSERETDEEYIRRKGWAFDWALLARAPLVRLQASHRQPAQRRVEVAGVPLDNITMHEALDAVEAAIDARQPRQVCFVNADCVNIAARDARYAALLRSGPLVLPDGSGVRLAARLAGGRLRENVNGTDLFPMLCERLAARRGRLYLLGAEPGAAEETARWATTHYPGLVVAGARHGYFAASQEDEVIREIRAAQPDVLLVAMGAPRQDLWIADRLDECGAPVAMGVGGLFNFYSQRVPRAPAWLREIGMEWAFRLLQEPRRLWRRYLVGNAAFLARVLWRRGVSGRNKPSAA